MPRGGRGCLQPLVARLLVACVRVIYGVYSSSTIHKRKEDEDVTSMTRFMILYRTCLEPKTAVQRYINARGAQIMSGVCIS